MATRFIDRAKGLFGRQPPSKGTPASPAKQPVAHHAVSIETGRNCCHSARILRGQRFLSREAPVLPLKNCMSDDCTCHYVHHDDRRAGPRRARDMGVAIDGWIKQEHRGGSFRGRRKADKSS